LRFWIAVGALACLAGCGQAEPTLDATSPETLTASLKAIKATLSPADAAAFEDDVTEIAINGMGGQAGLVQAASAPPAAPGQLDPMLAQILGKIRELEQGKTGPEIMALAKSEGLAAAR